MAQIELNDGKDPILLRDYECGWELCWQRNRYPDPKNKDVIEHYWAPFKWYPALSNALNAVAELKLRNSDATTLGELIVMVNKLKKEFMEVYNVNIGR